MPLYRKLNKDFFKKWSNDMAYVLGLFAADGTMLKNKRGAHFIEFHLTDKEILLRVRSVMGSSHKISIRKSDNVKHKNGYRLQIGSKIFFNDLSSLGFYPNKSLTMKFPKIPLGYLSHFVRGYFDGDGCVYFKKHFVRSRGKSRWFFSSRFTSGSLSFLVDLHQALRKNGLSKGFIVSKERGFELVFSHKDSLALFKFMYNNVTRGLYLHRKYRLFSKAVNFLYGYKIKMQS